MVYQVVTPNGEQLAVIDSFSDNWIAAINQKMSTEEPPSDKKPADKPVSGSLREFYEIKLTKA